MQTAPNRTQYYNSSRWRTPSWGTIVPALAAGLAAACLAFLLVRGRLPTGAAAPGTVRVVAAARDIPARTKLTAAMLTLRSVSPGDVPEGAAKTPALLVGKVSTQPIPAGTAVTSGVVTVPSAALGMAFTLPLSLRAVTVATDPADGTEVFVRPQDHVDILVTDEPGSGPASARTVLQNVLLLAVGSETSPDPPVNQPPAAPAPSGAAHVTVAVSPAQAQSLVLAAARGHLHLALRAIGDGSESSVPVSVAVPPHQVAVLAPRPAPPMPVKPPVPIRAAPPPAPKPPARVSIVIVKGSVSQTVSVAP